jgi:hypothetical protein
MARIAKVILVAGHIMASVFLAFVTRNDVISLDGHLVQGLDEPAGAEPEPVRA